MPDRGKGASPIVDMGAYETCPVDINKDGVVKLRAAVTE